jgi:O-methyltransferase
LDQDAAFATCDSNFTLFQKAALLFYRKLPAAEFQAFEQALTTIIETHGRDNVFVGDNLITIDRHVGFIADPEFMQAFRAETSTTTTKAVIWRLHTLCWAARHAVTLEGDFVECGVYEGFSSAVVARYLNFATLDKRLWLYDLFDHEQETSGFVMPAHSPGLYGRVVRRFSSFPNVRVIKGFVPRSFEQGAPERIAWMHVDLNDVTAETGALEVLFDRITPGGMLIFDDYGWKTYAGQKQAADEFALRKGYTILEMPTGQGLLVKK